MIRVRSIVALLLCAATLSTQARLLPDAPVKRSAVALPVTFQSGGISLEQAVAMVQSKYGAKVMRANSVEEDGRVVHYIRLMTPDRSRVWTVRVDAASGREF
jgi:uncharacterized membrane protein YkoI